MNGKYGVIKKDGTVIIEPTFDEVQIPNQDKDIFVLKLGDTYRVANEKNEDMFTGISNVSAIDGTSAYGEKVYNNTVLKYNSNEFLSAPEGYFPGTLFPQEQINAALSAPNSIARQELCPTFDSSGHGTHVAGICAGNGAASNGRYRGCAYEADLLIVKLGKSVNSSYPTTTQLMQAADWAIHYAASIGKPIAINLSFGNNYGAHDGSSLTEQFLNNLSNLWKCIIAAGTGNEGSGGIH